MPKPVEQKPAYELKGGHMAVSGIQRRVPACADRLSVLRQAVAAFAVDECANAAEIHDQLVLAVSEACTNVILHAYPDRTGEIALRAWVDRRYLRVEIRDEGVGIDTPSPNKGLGLGLQLMRTTAQARVDSGAGTTVQLRFPREPRSAAN